MDDEFLFCCLSTDEKIQLERELNEENYRYVYELQKNFTVEKNGIRCRKCGKWYPYRKLNFHNKILEAEQYKKFPGITNKYQKAALYFKKTHYYARNKNLLQKYSIQNGISVKEYEFNIMGETLYYAFSTDEQFVATATLKGTIAVQDLVHGDTIAKKRMKNTIHAFVFAPDGRTLVYFADGFLWEWDFKTNKTQNLVDCRNMFGDIEDKQHIVCKSLCLDSKKESYIMELCMNEKTILAKSSLDNIEILSERVPYGSVTSHVIHNYENGCYTIPCDGYGLLCDEKLKETERIDIPTIRKCLAPTGWAPISCFEITIPNRIFVSSDKKWALLDYFTDVILMRLSDQKIMFYLFDNNGSPAVQMGFIDEETFWYSWRATTYVHRIVEGQNS